MSIDVGQDFWQGASAHFRHRAASRSAARSERVVCFISPKFLYSLPFSVPAHLPWSQPAFCFWLRFQWALAFLLTKSFLSICYQKNGYLPTVGSILATSFFFGFRLRIDSMSGKSADSFWTFSSPSWGTGVGTISLFTYAQLCVRLGTFGIESSGENRGPWFSCGASGGR